MKKSFKWLVIILVVIFAVISIAVVALSTKINEKASPLNNTGIKKIAVFVDKEPYNPSSSKEIKIAIITVRIIDGDLKLNAIEDDAFNIARLNKALDEIKNRSALDLSVENEEVIDGRKAIVMKEIAVLKTAPEYIYAVKEALTMEFGFKTEIEK